MCHFFGMLEKGLKELEESLIKWTTLRQTLRSSSFVARLAAVASFCSLSISCSVRITTAILFYNLYRFLKIYVESICDLCPPHHICYEINKWQEFYLSQVLFHKKLRFLFSHPILCRKQTFLRSFQLSRPSLFMEP